MSNYGINKHIVLGNIGSDKNIRFNVANEGTQQEVTIGNFSLCANLPIGGGKTIKTWTQVVIIGNIAKAVRQFIKPGKQVYIEGYTRTRAVIDETTGNTTYWYETVVNDFTGTIRLLGDQNGNGRNTNPEQLIDEQTLAAMGYDPQQQKQHQHQPQQESQPQQQKVTSADVSQADIMEVMGRQPIEDNNATQKAGKKKEHKKDKPQETVAYENHPPFFGDNPDEGIPF